MLGFEKNINEHLCQTTNYSQNLLSLRPAADFQPLTFTDGHLKSERDPDVPQIFCPCVKSDSLYAAEFLSTMHSRRKDET